MSSENKKKNIFSFMYRDGKGVSKDDVLNVLEKPNTANFFKLLGRRFSQLLSVNMFYIFGNFPFLFALFAFAGYTYNQSVAPGMGLYSALKGSMYLANSSPAAASPVIASLNGIYGKQIITNIPTTATYIFFGLSLLILFTFGIVHVGCTYLVRNMVKGEHIFVWSDFWYCVKKNLKQAIIMGIIDLFITVMLIYDLIFFKQNMNVASFMTPMYFISFGMIFMYFFMRMYIYPMLITFDLSIFKLFKNAILFTVLGIKRNIMCLIGTALIIFINFALFMTFMPVGVILPFIIVPALLCFLSVYCAFPKIKEYMIDPYYKEIKEETEE